MFGFHWRQDVNEDETLYLDENGVPFTYDDLFHKKRVWKKAVPIELLAILTTSFFVLPFTSIVNGFYVVLVCILGVVILGILIFLVAREYRRYNAEPLHCSPDDGLLSVFQANSVKWLLRGSDQDPYPLDDLVPFTPPKTFFEWLIFRDSQTLQLKTSSQSDAGIVITLRDVRHVKHLVAIQKYRRSLQAKEVEQGHSMIDLLETTVDQNAKLIEVMNDIKSLLSMWFERNEPITPIKHTDPSEPSMGDTQTLP